MNGEKWEEAYKWCNIKLYVQNQANAITKKQKSGCRCVHKGIVFKCKADYWKSSDLATLLGKKIQHRHQAEHEKTQNDPCMGFIGAVAKTSKRWESGSKASWKTSSSKHSQTEAQTCTLVDWQTHKRFGCRFLKYLCYNKKSVTRERSAYDIVLYDLRCETKPNSDCDKWRKGLL